MAPLTAQRSMRSPAARSGSATCARVPIARRPTARRSALSGPCSAAGRTERSTARAQNGPPHLTAGSGATTICDDTRLSATNPRLLGSPSEPTCSGLTPRSGRCERGVVLVGLEELDHRADVLLEARAAQSVTGEQVGCP